MSRAQRILKKDSVEDDMSGTTKKQDLAKKSKKSMTVSKVAVKKSKGTKSKE